MSKEYTQEGKTVKDQFKEFIVENNYPEINDKIIMYTIHQQLIYQNEHRQRHKSRTHSVEHFIIAFNFLIQKNFIMQVKEQKKGEGECYFEQYT